MTNIAIIPTDLAIRYWQARGFLIVHRCANIMRITLIKQRPQATPKDAA